MLLRFCFFLLITLSATAADKYALLIGIGSYPNDVKLSGDKDIILMENTLQGLGFFSQNIKKLSNSEATKASILQEIRRLERTLKQGDVLVIHFSGHGKQIKDDDIDSITGLKEELDGLDEAIVCYDGEHIIDDEFQPLLLNIQKKAGKTGQIVLFFDCCFSSTMTRGGPVFQQENIQFDYSVPKVFILNELAPIYFFSSVSGPAPSEDLNRGYLSEAISKAFNANPITFSDLFSKIKDEIFKIPNSPRHHFQLPNFEGNGNATIFGDSEAHQELFFQITKNLGDSIIINGGFLSGIYKNSEIGLFPIGTRTPSTQSAIVVGTVTRSEAFQSTILLNQKISSSITTLGLWVFVTKSSFPETTNTIFLTVEDSLTFSKYLVDFPLLKLSTNYQKTDFTLLKKNKKFVLVDNYTSDSLVQNNLPEEVFFAAKKVAQANVFRKLESSRNTKYQVQLDLIPVSKSRVDLRDSLSRDLYYRGNYPTFDTSMNVVLKVTNTGSEPCYFSLINISSSGTIQVVLSPDEDRSLDYLLFPRSSFISQELLGFEPPYGNELIIAIASKKPININSIINNNWAQNRSSSSGNDQFFQYIYGGFRGAGTSDTSIYKYHYEIHPK